MALIYGFHNILTRFIEVQCCQFVESVNIHFKYTSVNGVPIFHFTENLYRKKTVEIRRTITKNKYLKCKYRLLFLN